MMARGRPPKPVETKRAEGNPGKRPLPDAVVMGGRGLPDPPPGLSDVATELWQYHVPMMADAGVLDRVDGPMLGVFFEAWAAAVVAARHMQADGPVVFDPNDFTGEMKARKNPAVTAWKEAAAVMRQFGEQFGLTPSARARLGMVGVQGRDLTLDPDIPSAPATLRALDGGRKGE